MVSEKPDEPAANQAQRGERRGQEVVVGSESPPRPSRGGVSWERQGGLQVWGVGRAGRGRHPWGPAPVGLPLTCSLWRLGRPRGRGEVVHLFSRRTWVPPKGMWGGGLSRQNLDPPEGRAHQPRRVQGLPSWQESAQSEQTGCFGKLSGTLPLACVQRPVFVESLFVDWQSPHP